MNINEYHHLSLLLVRGLLIIPTLVNQLPCDQLTFTLNIAKQKGF
jgi:hypothetical protein